VPINYFIGKTRTWLETELSKAQAEFAAGVVVTGAGSGDVHADSEIQVNVRERIERLLYALYLIDPDDYPASSFQRVTRTKMIVAQDGC
jgi:hypothetical protein